MIKKTLLATTCLMLLNVVLPNKASAATLKIDCGSSQADGNFCQYLKQRFENETEHTLEFVNFPPSSDEKLGIFQQLFAAKDSDAIDVFLADTVWIGILQKHLLDLTDNVTDINDAFFPATWNNNVIDGRVYGIPAFLDTGMLFYRKDLLEKYGENPPETWEELARISQKIQEKERESNPNFWGYVFQGKSYEGLTCNALEWIASYNGGVFVEKDGSISINNEQASHALDMAASWIGSIAPEGVMGYMEEESRALFQNGDALFLRNWPYVYVLTQAENSSIKGKVGVSKLPKGGEDGMSVNALGGWQWVVNKYSKNHDAAITLIKMATDEEGQKAQLKIKGNSPSRMSLYDDAEVIAIAPYLTEFKDVFQNATARPSSQVKNQYAKVSNAIFNSSFDVLRGNKTGSLATQDLESRLQKIKGKQWK